VVCALMGSLRVLDLSDNKLGPEGGTALAEGLKGNSTLTELK
jgi:Ran GTPase-activating protein (RanGAP) involved in mRNA processing and transport